MLRFAAAARALPRSLARRLCAPSSSRAGPAPRKDPLPSLFSIPRGGRGPSAAGARSQQPAPSSDDHSRSILDKGIDDDGASDASDADAGYESAGGVSTTTAAWYSSQSRSAAQNPYTDATRNYSRHPVAVPSVILRAVDGVLRSRNLAMLSQHWRDMTASAEERNASLLRAVRLREKVEAARAAGALKDVPPGAVSTDSPPLLYGPKEALAHTLHALLPSYGLAVRVFEDVAAGLPPSWAPRSILDFGAGPGSATLAARDVWPDSLTDACVLVDPSRAMAQIAEHMLAAAEAPGVAVRRSLEEVKRLHRGRTFDVVVAHFALSELPTDKERDAVVSELWELVRDGGGGTVSASAAYVSSPPPSGKSGWRPRR